jgi:hypothetical protein
VVRGNGMVLSCVIGYIHGGGVRAN